MKYNSTSYFEKEEEKYKFDESFISTRYLE